ncbi:NAD(+)/NADH kinase [Actinocatenispora comari]|jgi:NAD+ kinase|uniref:NAD kinase n=1 Tax=Actinocatenispora comari TaxID=2807577 RepID=A0A8J4A7G3_9ACTN|nr:NAD(+)/NADH kinase [Actinocatenispora comari]GIL25605.1 NAD kinase [Actinocatenispora comari]
MAKVETLGLVLHPTRDVTSVVSAVLGWSADHGVAVRVGAADADRAAGARAVPEDELAGSDAILSIGGDGTMLGALRLVSDDPRPVLGVNMGKLGFLVEIEPPELVTALDRLAAGDVTLEHHSCLRVTSGDSSRMAFNDLALSRRPGDGTVNAILTIDDQQYGYFRADAVIMATATGSTAHSYSAGGPLLSPVTDAVVITPVAPMSGISRPLVLGAGERVEFSLLSDVGRPVIEADGQVLGELEPGRTVRAELRRDAGLVVRLDVRRHRQRSQAKLSLLDLPLLPDQLRELLPPQVRDQLARRESP